MMRAKEMRIRQTIAYISDGEFLNDKQTKQIKCVQVPIYTCFSQVFEPKDINQNMC